MATPTQPWGQLRDESSARYAAFCAWAILPSPRRFEPIAHLTGRTVEELESWAQTDFWQERAQALDDSHADALARASLEARVRDSFDADALQRGQQQRLVMVRALTVADELLQRAQLALDANPMGLDLDIVQAVQKLAPSIEKIVKLERLAAGQLTDNASLTLDLSALSDDDLEAGIKLQRKVRK